MSLFVFIAFLFTSFKYVCAGEVTYSTTQGRKTCTVTALGEQQDDTPNIVQAFNDCASDSLIVFPEDQSYWIATRLNPVLNNVEIEWRGEWILSDNLTYWRNNSYPITFQNHRAGFVISGSQITLNGYGTGGISGNGNAWYNAEHGTTQPGRPMPFVWWNVSTVSVDSFYVHDSPLWALNIMNGTNMQFTNIDCNSTAVNAPFGSNWVQNTDGFDTMDSQNILLENFTYQGGDDCIAIKPRSYDITIRNIACHGGNGVAIGSLGQYLEDSSVSNVLVSNASIIRRNNDMEDGAYIKTWVGALVPQSSYESAGQPRGGGWGVVNNIRFENFYLEGPNTAIAITQDSGDNGSFVGTSKMEVSNIAFVNFTGYTYGSKAASISCSNVHPCFGINVENFNVGVNDTGKVGSEACSLIAPGGVHGLNGTSCT